MYNYKVTNPSLFYAIEVIDAKITSLEVEVTTLQATLLAKDAQIATLE